VLVAAREAVAAAARSQHDQALKEFQLKFQTGRTRCRFRGGDPKLPSCRMVHVARPLLLLLALFLRADADSKPFSLLCGAETRMSGFVCSGTRLRASEYVSFGSKS